MKAYWWLLPFLVGCADLDSQAVTSTDEKAGSGKVKLEEVKADRAPMKSVANRTVSSISGKIVTDKRWDRTQSVKPALVLINSADSAVNLTIRSGMAADFVLSQGGEVVWRYSQEMSFTQALGKMTVAAASERTIAVVISARTLQTLAPGQYQLHASVNALKPESSPLVKPVMVEIY